MEKRVLVVCATKSGSTAEVAQAIGQELGRGGARVDVRLLQEAGDLGTYDAVVVGAPMIMGWHREAVEFVCRQREALSRVPVAYFLTALSLTQSGEGRLDGVPVYQDPALTKPPRNPTRLSLKEGYATVANYLGPALRKAPDVRPVSAGFFAGKLDLARLDLLSRLVVQLIGARSGDQRNWEAIRTWATGLRPALLGD
ncbi:MAG TPA: flavodoxin domain-containing protein [Anaerolineae bacterium]|nr:flavodoxin domain-containing protein [Anaerolineae bacterium]HOQ99199.1 flavodoxin domain-containing protein [Anaerolineae bacterium]HPL27959.1 flavodoxin domain-containing protein [Anaerolineae bacterium]